MENAKSKEPWIDRELAGSVARLLLGRACIEVVYAFGSVARSGRGRDLDIVAAAEESVVEDFLAGVNEQWQPDYDVPTQLPPIRWNEACRILDLSEQELLAVQSPAVPQKLRWLDIILLPTDWTHRLDELQHRLPSDDPNFMNNIGGDAILYQENSGQFAPRLTVKS